MRNKTQRKSKRPDYPNLGPWEEGSDRLLIHTALLARREGNLCLLGEILDILEALESGYADGPTEEEVRAFVPQLAKDVKHPQLCRDDEGLGGLLDCE